MESLAKYIPCKKFLNVVSSTHCLDASARSALGQFWISAAFVPLALFQRLKTSLVD